MPSLNNFSLSRFKESNKTLRQRAQQTHREEAPRGGGYQYHKAMPPGLANGDDGGGIF